MKSKIIILAVALLSGIAFSMRSVNQTPKVLTMERTETLSDNEEIPNCKETHENGCHTGGPGKTECSIGDNFYACIGGVGGDCSIECREGYACCGLSCKCVGVARTYAK